MSNGDVSTSCIKIKPGDQDAKCSMCLSTENDPFLYGDLYKCGKIVVHYFCLLFSSSLVQAGGDHEGILGFLPKDVLKEIRRGSRLKCCYCRKNGATIGCQKKSCKKSFHLPCGLKKDSMHQFYDQFLSFCVMHRPHQKVTAAVEDDDAQMCPICYESVSNIVTNQTLWAPCCKRRWFHRGCLQRQALAQGYFFKCPTCNNNDIFPSEMKKFGIYVPEMDAAWEREPNAFRDLLIAYKNCDALICKCQEREGRKYSQNTGSWRLLRCNSCGSQGTHIACSALKLTALNNSWSCSTCTEVINKGKLILQERAQTRPHTSSANFRPDPSTPTSSSSSLRRPADTNQVIHVNKKRKPSPSMTNQDHTPVDESDEDIDIIVVDSSESDDEVVGHHHITTNEGKQIQVHKVIAAPGSEETKETAAPQLNYPLPIYWIPVNIGGQPALQPVVPINATMLNSQSDVVCLD